SLRNQWEHWFYGDARALWPDNVAVQDHVARDGWMDLPRASELPDDAADPRVGAVAAALFQPVVRDYRLVATRIGTRTEPVAFTDAKTMVQAFPQAHLPHLEHAFEALVERGILTVGDTGQHAWGPRAHDVDDFTARSALPAPR